MLADLLIPENFLRLADGEHLLHNIIMPVASGAATSWRKLLSGERVSHQAALRMPGQAKWDRNLDRGGKASVGIVDVELTAGKPGNIVTGYALQPDLLSDGFNCRGGIDPAVIVGRAIGDDLVVDVFGILSRKDQAKVVLACSARPNA